MRRTAAVGEEILVLIDQEGGRVQRLRPPHWRALPAAAAYAKAYAGDLAEGGAGGARRGPADGGGAARGRHQHQLRAPAGCAGSRQPRRHRRSGLRGGSASDVAALGAAVAEGLMAGGVLPVIKHIPGHGRATADSHFDLPVVTATREELEAIGFRAVPRAGRTCPRP